MDLLAPNKPKNNIPVSGRDLLGSQIKEESKSIGGFAGNLLPSLGNTLEGVVSGVGQAVLHPVETFKGVRDLAVGGLTQIPGVKEFYDSSSQRDGLFMKKEDKQAGLEKARGSFNTVTDYYKQRYGGNSLPEVVKNMGNTSYNDPFGVALDLAGLLQTESIGLNVSSKAAKTVGLTKTANTLENVSKATNIAGKATSGVKSGINNARIAVTPIEEQVVTALKESDMPTLTEYLEQAKKASRRIQENTPLEIAGKKAEDALDMIGKLKNEAGEAKNTAVTPIAKKNVSGILNNSISKFKSDVAEKFGLILNNDGTVSTMPGRAISIPNDDVYQLQEMLKELNGLKGRGSNVNFERQVMLKTVDDTIDKIQRDLYSKKGTMGARPVNDAVEATIKSHLGKLNGAIQEVGGKSYQASNATYAELSDIYSKLNKALGPSGTRGGSLMKKVFSPADSGTKELFKRVKEITGVDLSNQAVLAKFAMEVLGDTRQKNLLQELDVLPRVGGTGGDIVQVLKWLHEKMIDKELKAKAIVK